MAFILVTFIYHRIMLHKEKPLLESPLGQMVEVDGNQMSIYTEGEGDHRLVIMSGGGEISPILGYGTLYRKLSDTYKIAVIEKFGYGFIDVVDGERDFDTILRQDREALQKAGDEAPYILCPHSMSGIEAILWVQKYPDEVEEIVGLDMSTPKSFTEEELADGEKTMVALYTFLRKSGLGRLVLTDSTFPDHYDRHEKEIYKPDVPTLLFLSDGKETGGQTWIDAMHDYADGLTDARVTELNCGHVVTEEKPDEIAAAMREFIAGLDKPQS